MLVPASVVGAIIGKGGQTVRQITQLKVFSSYQLRNHYVFSKDSRARVDVHKREGHGSDKVATIYGAPEACGVAANRILDIIRKEERDDDLPLKLLAHNALIGRLIGRDGRNLKQIQVQKLNVTVITRVIHVANDFFIISETDCMSPESLSS